jgi:hypothetical protein
MVVVESIRALLLPFGTVVCRHVTSREERRRQGRPHDEHDGCLAIERFAGDTGCCNEQRIKRQVKMTGSCSDATRFVLWKDEKYQPRSIYDITELSTACN